jgi:di/tripeptidase
MQHVYVIVRDDLTNPQRTVQAVHAGIAAARELIPTEEPHPNLVILTVPDEEHLVRAAHCLDLAGIRYRRFVEEDLGRQFTSLATAPVDAESRRHFRRFPLLA